MCEVTILCTTYNQDSYLEQAIESMLTQVTSFEYEIIIHDDASVDCTYEIAMKYQRQYPDIVRVIRSEENEYSRGIDFNTPIIINEARGKYIAICEGDDFWMDNHKLQLQYEALEKHPESDMCACWGSTVTEDGKREISQIRPYKYDTVLSAEEVILGGGQFLVTASLFFRKEMCYNMFGLDSLDYSWQMRGAIRGGIIYLNRKMAAYRKYAKGSWTNTVLLDNERLKLQWDREIYLLKTLDEHTNGKYHSVIEERLKAYISFEEQLLEREEEVIKVVRDAKMPCFIWGCGRRGRSLEAFLQNKKIRIEGVCDATNNGIGSVDEYGNIIFCTDDVLRVAATILASTKYVYDDLRRMNIDADVVDLQQYMPQG